MLNQLLHNDFTFLESKRFVNVALFIVVFLQVILMFHGFDVCDDGFVLTFYQQIFNDPSSVEYSFVYWLSGFFGGLWYEIYPSGGVLWFKFFTVIINTLTYIITFQVFQQFISKPILILGLFIALFVNDYGFLVYYHNHLTALLAVTSVFFLLKGLFKNSLFLIVISGFIIGINIFTRIPNITLLVFILAIPFYYLIENKLLKKSIKPSMYYILGVILGIICIGILLLLLGQFEIMIKAIYSLFDLGVAKDSSHNLVGLLMVYLHDYKNLLDVMGQLLLISIGFCIVYNYFKNLLWLRNLLLFVLFCYTFLWFLKGEIYPVYAISYVGSLLVLFTKQSSKLKVLAFLGILMLTFLPLGSGGAIHSSGYMCIWLSVPFFFYFIANLKDVTIHWNCKTFNNKIIFSRVGFKSIILFIFMAFFLAKGLNISKQAYFDKGSRLEKTHSIENKLAKGIFTTERRAKIINDLLINLDEYVKPNDYLLAYDKIPMINFLTETRPYMYNSWVWIYDSHSFEKKLNQAEKEIKVYPIVVAQKFETTLDFSEPIPNYLDENLINTEGLINAYDGRKNAFFNAFLTKNDYKIIWSNDYFNIYKTESIHE